MAAHGDRAAASAKRCRGRFIIIAGSFDAWPSKDHRAFQARQLSPGVARLRRGQKRGRLLLLDRGSASSASKNILTCLQKDIKVISLLTEAALYKRRPPQPPRKVRMERPYRSINGCGVSAVVLLLIARRRIGAGAAPDAAANEHSADRDRPRADPWPLACCSLTRASSSRCSASIRAPTARGPALDQPVAKRPEDLAGAHATSTHRR